MVAYARQPQLARPIGWQQRYGGLLRSYRRNCSEDKAIEFLDTTGDSPGFFAGFPDKMVSRDIRESQPVFSRASADGAAPTPRLLLLRWAGFRSGPGGSLQYRETFPDEGLGLGGSLQIERVPGHYRHGLQPTRIIGGFARSNFCTLRGRTACQHAPDPSPGQPFSSIRPKGLRCWPIRRIWPASEA
jgi:hypothetical protein